MVARPELHQPRDLREIPSPAPALRFADEVEMARHAGAQEQPSSWLTSCRTSPDRVIENRHDVDIEPRSRGTTTVTL